MVVRLATRGGRRPRIWIVVVEGRPYVRSLRGRAGGWYRDLASDPTAIVESPDVRVEVRATAVSEPATLSKVGRAYAAKYGPGWPEHTEEMLEEGPRAATLRLDPA